MRVLYTVLYLHLLPLALVRLYWRSLKSVGYRQRIHERFGQVPARKDDSPLLWVHAVSVGETIAATPLIQQWQAQHPDWRICVTTTTPTGSDRVRAAFGDSVLHYYLPYDVPSFIQRFIRRLKPSALVIMETELWPNLLAICSEESIPSILANGRMSERSMQGYRKLGSLTRPMFEQLRVISAQSTVDASRFVALGAPDAHVVTTGSIKFDVSISDEVLDRRDALAQQLHIAGRKVCVFASTHPGEDEQLLPLIQQLYAADKRFLAVIVPRHPERFDAVVGLCQQQAVSAIRVTDKRPVSASTVVVVGDTMGDMLALYGLADAAFIGGSLIDHGGHNFLEAAAWGIPIFSGKHVFNFQSVADALVKAEGMTLVQDANALQTLLGSWLVEPRPWIQTGEAARQVLDENRGALDRLMAILESALIDQHAVAEAKS